MKEVLDRPKDLERPYMLLVVGYPAADAVVLKRTVAGGTFAAGLPRRL